MKNVSVNKPSEASFQVSSTLQQPTEHFANGEPYQYSTKLDKRVTELREAAKEEYPEQAPMSEESLENFISFIKINQALDCPTLVLTYEGNLIAQWRSSDSYKVAIEFLDGNNVDILCVTPNPKHKSKIERLNLETTRENVFDIVGGQGAKELLIPGIQESTNEYS